MNEQITFYAVYDNENVIARKSFAGINNLPGNKYIIRCALRKSDGSSVFKILNDQEEETNIKIGYFQCIKIETGGGFFDADYTIYDERTNAFNHIIVPISGGPLHDGIVKNLLPSLHLLNSLGSCEAFNDHHRINKLEKENKVFKTEIEDLKKQIEDLSSPKQ